MAALTSDKLLPFTPHRNPIRRLPLRPSTLRVSSPSTDLSPPLHLSPPSAFDHYQEAKSRPGFKPDKQTLASLSRSLLKCRLWDSLSLLADDFVAFSLSPDAATSATLISSCIKSRKFKLAHSLLAATHHDPAASLSSYSAAMKAFNKLHMYTTTVDLHNQLLLSPLPPSLSITSAAMEAHRKLNNPAQVLSLFLHLKTLTPPPRPDPLSLSRIYSSLCETLSSASRPFEALRFFREMQTLGLPPSSSLYSSLISSFAKIKEAEIAEDLFLEAKSQNLARDPALFLNLVLMHVDLGNPRKTLAIVKTMQTLNLGVSDCVLCAVVNGHARKLGQRAGVAAYEELLAMGCKPGQVTYASAISIYSKLGLLPMAEALFKEMMSRGFDRCVVAYSAMISAYGKVGRVREAGRLLARMKEKGCEPNVWVYNAMIDMYGKGGDLRRVEKLWKEMRRRRVGPDRVTYTAMIGAYGRAREMGECLRLYEEFRMSGEKVDRAVVGVMVGVFAKSGRVDELLKMMREVEEEGLGFDERLYGSAMNALRDAGLEGQVRWMRKSFLQGKKKQS